jgi:hypothetical protein
MSLALKMYEIMCNVDKVIKDLNVNFNKVSYKGISHDQVTEIIRKQLIDQKVISIVKIKNHSQDGNRTEVDIDVEFRDVENPDDVIIVPGFGYGIDTQDKGPGKEEKYSNMQKDRGIK